MEFLGEIGASLEQQFEAAASAVFAELESQAGDRPLVVAVCGGRSVVGLVKSLAHEAKGRLTATLARVHFFMVDERLVPITDPDSNFGGLQRSLFNELIELGAISAEQLHPLRVERPEQGAQACESYLKELKGLAGAFSVVILGMGEDGHIAGLFPRHPALSQRGDQFISFHDSPKPPPDRMTASRDLITKANLSVLLAIGEAKLEAWNRLNTAGTTIEECPAMLALEARRCLVVTDLR